MSDLISRQAAIDELMVRDKELRNINWYDKPYAEGECRGIDEALAIVSNLPSAQPERTENARGTHACDLIERQAAIDALKGLPTWWADEGGYYGGAQPPMVALLDPEDAVSAIENLPSVHQQPEEDCNTCKHGYFGDRQCDNCRVRYPSHYERKEEHNGFD